MKLTEMRELLAARGIQLTKSLGQNFLHDANQLRRIVEAAELKESDKVLEVGPGLGPLTELLLEQAGEVLAIEKDGRLVEVLCERLIPKSEIRNRKFELLHADVLEVLQHGQRDWGEWKLVANLPYSVASRILVELAQTQRCPERMVVTLQSEVAQRLMAKPGDKDYGVLTLLIQLDYEPRDWFKIPRSCFFPEPDVDSVCVALMRRVKALLTEERRITYLKIVKRAFSQRRKMMMKVLKADWPLEKLEQAFAELKISPQARAEKLGLEQFVCLTLNLLDSVGDEVASLKQKRE
jgi:16S rRNA (adenine1518-N6/adenine1519-N6)-dimethyltransferase